MLEILVLVIALCIDEFVASIAYGADRIRITWKEVVIINVVCSACLGVALCLGTVIRSMIPPDLTKAVCFASLFLLGIVKLLDYSVKKYINRHCDMQKKISFSFSHLFFIISIYGNPTAADKDHSQSLSMRESLFLAFAMSIDSLIAGTFAALLKVHIWLTVLMAFFVGVVAVYVGQMLGRKIAAQLKWDLSWMSGALFMILAVSKVMS